MSLEIFRVHMGDFLASQAVQGVLNPGHNGRIRQATLDFYRDIWKKFNSGKKSGGEILFLVGLSENVEPIAISACAIPRATDVSWHSITVVHPNHRNTGIGKQMLANKLLCMNRFYPKHRLKTYVSKANEHSVKMCNSVGLSVIDEGTRERPDKEPTSFFVYSEE